MDRRLAAILVADVVGFSRLMERDEAGTLAALRQRRIGVLEPVVKEHRGRVVKLMGDGVLVEFASAVNAVAAALDLQKRMGEANEGVAEDRRIQLRIGINLGDVVGAGSDIYGDGVNVAARLEALAEPGGICVSGKVREEVLGKTAAFFEEMGEQSLKNIAVPVRVWRVRVSASSEPGLTHEVSMPTKKPSVAILPFDNMSGDPSQDSFCDGVAEEIIAAVSRFKTLFVVARNSSFAFRGQKLTIPEIAKRLGVDYVLEGSVRRASNRVRVTAQLIEAQSGNHLWSEHYDRTGDDILAIHDDISTSISTTLVRRIEDDAAINATQRHTGNLKAFNYMMKGFQLQQKQGRENLRQAIELHQKAIEADPALAEAYAYLGLCYWDLWWYDLNPRDLRRWSELGHKGLSLDPNSLRSHMQVGCSALYKWEFAKSEKHLRWALALNPNDVGANLHFGMLLTYLGKAAESHPYIEKAFKLNPFPPKYYYIYRGMALYSDRQYEKAVWDLSVGETDFVVELMYLAAALGQLGKADQAVLLFAECARLKPDLPVIAFAKAEPYLNPADTEHLIDGLRKAGLDA
jgi:TolB-like protein